MTKKYLPTKKNRLTASFLIVGILIFGVLVMYWNDTSRGLYKEDLFWGWTKGIAFLAFIGILLVNGSRVVLEENSVIWVRMFIFRTGSNIGQIEKIEKGPIAISGMPAIFIRYINKLGFRSAIQMSIGFFEENEIARLLKDLRALRPDIPMDAACRKLIEAYP